METKEEAEGQEDRAPSPYWYHLSDEEAMKVDGEALHAVHSGSSDPPRLPPPGHRRSQSEVSTTGHRRDNSFQRLKTQMQKAWRWGGNSRDERYRSTFNPEVLANQKRLWYQLHSKTMVFSPNSSCPFFFFIFCLFSFFCNLLSCACITCSCDIFFTVNLSDLL